MRLQLRLDAAGFVLRIKILPSSRQKEIKKSYINCLIFRDVMAKFLSLQLIRKLRDELLKIATLM